MRASPSPIAIRTLQARYAELRTRLPGHGAPGGTERLEHTLDWLAN